MYKTATILALAGAVVARPSPLSLKRDIASTKTICFDFGDCLIFGGMLASCDRTGDNSAAFGILGTCVPQGGATKSSGGLFGKRHGPDGDEDETTVSVNATVAAKRQIIGDLIGATSDAVQDTASIGSDIIGNGIDATKDALGAILSIPGDLLGFGGYGYDDKVKRQIIGDLISATHDAVQDGASIGSDILGSGIDATKDALGALLSIPSDLLGLGGYGGYGYDDKVKRQIIGDLISATHDAVQDGASIGSDILGSGIDATKDALGALLSIPGDILGFGGYGYDD